MVHAITAEGIRSASPEPRSAPHRPRAANAPWTQAGRTGHNLLLTSSGAQGRPLRFLANLAVPFTNNQAEQDPAHGEAGKSPAASEVEQGANDFATIRGFISTR